MLKNRETGFYVSLLACAIGFIGLILYIVLDHSDADRTFSPVVCVMIALAVAAEAYVIVCGHSLSGLVVSAFYAAGLGFLLRATIGPLSDVWNGVNFIGGNAFMGVTFSGVFLVCMILSVVSNYLGVGKKK